MHLEIERKFLVASERWREAADSGVLIRQGYLARGRASVRVRLLGDRAFLAIKGPRRGLTRHEFEYEIPWGEAELMLADYAAAPMVEKTRFEVAHGRHVWEVDVYGGALTGLVLAEIELDREDEAFERPAWLGAEVSGDARFSWEGLARRAAGQASIGAPV
ncbi:CYTH domain-containing protein [Caulobacter sp.]|uniref:CYTH domain-containing protein n=1 Tax=Caulobacter sp. TaxID=78 RepID=UPI0031D0C9D9